MFILLMIAITGIILLNRVHTFPQTKIKNTPGFIAAADG
jgi:hypothetical protein